MIKLLVLLFTIKLYARSNTYSVNEIIDTEMLLLFHNCLKQGVSN